MLKIRGFVFIFLIGLIFTSGCATIRPTSYALATKGLALGRTYINRIERKMPSAFLGRDYRECIRILKAISLKDNPAVNNSSPSKRGDANLVIKAYQNKIPADQVVCRDAAAFLRKRLSHKFGNYCIFISRKSSVNHIAYILKAMYRRPDKSVYYRYHIISYNNFGITKSHTNEKLWNFIQRQSEGRITTVIKVTN